MTCRGRTSEPDGSRLRALPALCCVSDRAGRALGDRQLNGKCGAPGRALRLPSPRSPPKAGSCAFTKPRTGREQAEGREGHGAGSDDCDLALTPALDRCPTPLMLRFPWFGKHGICQPRGSAQICPDSQTHTSLNNVLRLWHREVSRNGRRFQNTNARQSRDGRGARKGKGERPTLGHGRGGPETLGRCHGVQPPSPASPWPPRP